MKRGLPKVNQLAAKRAAPEKLCVFCRYYKWEDSLSMACSWTGQYGSKGHTCAKGHYYERNADDADEMRAIFLTAETCPDYERPAK